VTNYYLIVQFVESNTVSVMTVRIQVIRMGFCVGKVTMEQNFSKYVGFTRSSTNPLCSTGLFRYGKLF
jgi:hypothetical protein